MYNVTSNIIYKAYFQIFLKTLVNNTSVHVRSASQVASQVEDSLIIKDQMAGLGCLFLCTFGKFLAPVLIAAHAANNLDFGDEQGYESD